MASPSLSSSGAFSSGSSSVAVVVRSSLFSGCVVFVTLHCVRRVQFSSTWSLVSDPGEKTARRTKDNKQASNNNNTNQTKSCLLLSERTTATITATAILATNGLFFETTNERVRSHCCYRYGCTHARKFHLTQYDTTRHPFVVCYGRQGHQEAQERSPLRAKLHVAFFEKKLPPRDVIAHPELYCVGLPWMCFDCIALHFQRRRRWW